MMVEEICRTVSVEQGVEVSKLRSLGSHVGMALILSNTRSCLVSSVELIPRPAASAGVSGGVSG